MSLKILFSNKNLHLKSCFYDQFASYSNYHFYLLKKHLHGFANCYSCFIVLVMLHSGISAYFSGVLAVEDVTHIPLCLRNI